MGRPRLDENDGYDALRRHLVDRAHEARARYGPTLDREQLERLLADETVVRFPTTLSFDDGPLLAGEFAWPRPRGTSPREGFELVCHPHFRDRPELPLLVAYHVPSINYLDVVTHVEAELFGATLNGLAVDDYYARLCALADELDVATEGRPPAPASCGQGCSCSAAPPTCDPAR